MCKTRYQLCHRCVTYHYITGSGSDSGCHKMYYATGYKVCNVYAAGYTMLYNVYATGYKVLYNLLHCRWHYYMLGSPEPQPVESAL